MWCSLILEHGGFPIHGGIQLPPEVHHHLACWGFPSRLPEREPLGNPMIYARTEEGQRR